MPSKTTRAFTQLFVTCTRMIQKEGDFCCVLRDWGRKSGDLLPQLFRLVKISRDSQTPNNHQPLKNKINLRLLSWMRCLIFDGKMLQFCPMMRRGFTRSFMPKQGCSSVLAKTCSSPRAYHEDSAHFFNSKSISFRVLVSNKNSGIFLPAKSEMHSPCHRQRTSGVIHRLMSRRRLLYHRPWVHPRFRILAAERIKEEEWREKELEQHHV